MSIGIFDPGATEGALDTELVQVLLRQFADTLPNRASDDVERFSVLARHPGWPDVVEGFATPELIRLVKIFTLLERGHLAFSAGADSPVITMVRALKSKGAWDRALSQWVKSNTDNKFLPHGNLMERL
ncbi:MAG: hypothetical protein VYE04_06705 [Pseudomonadota bacterium]|nr:hypothetical protein [Pseudomonadota bacterium]